MGINFYGLIIFTGYCHHWLSYALSFIEWNHIYSFAVPKNFLRVSYKTCPPVPYDSRGMLLITPSGENRENTNSFTFIHPSLRIVSTLFVSDNYSELYRAADVAGCENIKLYRPYQKFAAQDVSLTTVDGLALKCISRTSDIFYSGPCFTSWNLLCAYDYREFGCYTYHDTNTSLSVVHKLRYPSFIGWLTGGVSWL